jgi:hypothetical protein
MPADETALVSTPRVQVNPARMTRELTFIPRDRHEPKTPEKGGAGPVARHALTRCQYITMSGSSCLPHATIPPCTCIASEKPAFLTMASTSAERTPVLQ